MDSSRPRDTHPYSDATSAYPDANPDSFSHAYPNADAKSDPHTQPDADAESHANTHSHTNAESNAYAHSNAYAGVRHQWNVGGTWRWRRHRDIAKAYLSARVAHFNMYRSNAAGSL